MLTLNWIANADQHDLACIDTFELPVTLTEPEIEVLVSDCCETIIQPSITRNDLKLLRRALIEGGWDQADYVDQLDEVV